MPVQISPESEYGKELARWEQHPQPWAPTPGRPYRFAPYPRMLYQARKRDDGRIVCLDERAAVGDPIAESWNRSCQMEVHNEDEHQRATRQGWCDSPAAAIECADAQERAIADAAAEAAYAAQRMSAKARAEWQAADKATAEHVTDVTPASQAATQERLAAEAQPVRRKTP